MVSTPVADVGAWGSDAIGGGVGDDPVGRVGDGAGKYAGEGTSSMASGGIGDVVGEGFCIRVSVRTCGKVDDCIISGGSGARAIFRVRSSGEGRTTLSAQSG